MNKSLLLLLCLCLTSVMSLQAQNPDHAAEATPLDKETPTELEQQELDFQPISATEEEEGLNEKTKTGKVEEQNGASKKLCINVSPSEQKEKEKKEKAAELEKEGLEKKLPKCTKPKSKEEATKKKKRASTRVKLVSYKPVY